MWQRSEDILQKYTTKAINFLEKKTMQATKAERATSAHISSNPFYELGGDTTYQQREAARLRKTVTPTGSLSNKADTHSIPRSWDLATTKNSKVAKNFKRRDFSPKKIYKWPISIWKNGGYHWALEKYKIPQQAQAGCSAAAKPDPWAAPPETQLTREPAPKGHCPLSSTGSCGTWPPTSK